MSWCHCDRVCIVSDVGTLWSCLGVLCCIHVTVYPASAVSCAVSLSLVATVLQVFGDGTSSHYTSFGDYTRAISMHQVFSGLKSFRHVWVSSTFTKWLMNARQSRFHRMRQQIAQRLLLLKPSYRSALMEARGKLEQLADIGAMSDLPNGNYKIDAFVKQQTESQR